MEDIDAILCGSFEIVPLGIMLSISIYSYSFTGRPSPKFRARGLSPNIIRTWLSLPSSKNMFTKSFVLSATLQSQPVVIVNPHFIICMATIKPTAKASGLTPFSISETHIDSVLRSKPVFYGYGQDSRVERGLRSGIAPTKRLDISCRISITSRAARRFSST